MKMKLMLVDDHSLFLEGLQYLLETHGISVVGTARNGREALVKARVLRPEIILMDIRMPECDGLDALKLIKAEMPDIKIIMLTTSEGDDDLFNAIKYGASGYLLKTTDAKDLLDMLSDIENNEAHLSSDLAGKLLREFRRNNINDNKSIQHTSGSAKEEKLTERQLEVLEMVAKGLTYKKVGDILGLTERTVKYHMARILDVLHLENRSQVIAYAVQMGLIDSGTE